MKTIRWILILIALPFFSGAQQVSGYITMKYLGGYTYQSTIVDYTFSCDSLSVGGDTIRLYYGDGASSLLNRSNGSGDSVCDCRKENIYTSTHTYPGPGNYRLWFDGGPRIADISNMVTSNAQDMEIFYSLTIPPSESDTSFPIITNPPVCSYGCLTQCYHFNLDAYSPAGDSISYSLGNCLVGIGYYNPGATINSATGEISWCNPTADGLWNFAVLMVTYQKTYTIIGSDTIKNEEPMDTEEVELEVNVQNDCSLGINKITNDNEAINVYPNPCNGIFAIALSHPAAIAGAQVIVEIYNVMGQRIYNATLKQVQGDNAIDISSQPNGIYLYRVISDNGNLVGEGKLIIQK